MYNTIKITILFLKYFHFRGSHIEGFFILKFEFYDFYKNIMDTAKNIKDVMNFRLRKVKRSQEFMNSNFVNWI